MSSKTPAKIGKYDVTGILGRGGMGIVYKATDPFLDRLVAIKMMTGGYSDNPDLLKRFFREAQSTGSLQHPNIVTVYELGDHGGNPYLVMEFLEGESLDSIIASHKQLTLLEKINLIIEVCQGLGYAHQRGIVHRDIKPANIMVSKDGVVKIVDFGIAHLGDKNVTRTGQIMGSVSYMAPEQLNGKPVDPRTDIFATGVVLYQLITYTAPFDGENTAATLLKILHEPAPPLKNFLSVYPPELDTILLKALSKNREDRYFSADDFALDLGQLQGQLKQELVGKHLQEASTLLEKADLYKAKDQLLQVLRIDRQNTQANLLLREIQQRIQREEISEQVRQLRAQAEEAFAQEHFEVALEHLQRALSLDRGNVELQRLRESIDTAWSRARKLQETLKRAEFAHQEGDLDYAKQAVEEALELAPGDAHVKALHRTIQREWAERSRQRQVENYLDQARREISARNFTSALEILKQADSLDPNAPQVKVLIESATAGRELEHRRRELEAIARQIEEALNRDDFVAACRTAAQGLERFPEERTLLKLKALAEKQRQIAERKQFVDEQLANARTLLEQGRSEELLSALEAALAKTGPEPRLESLLLIVRDNVQRERTERRKAEYLQKAKDALRQKSYDQAIQILQTARTELNDANEIVDLLQFAKEEAVAEQRRQIVEATAHQANDLIAQQEYEQAIKLLETTLQEVPDEELRIILAEARRSSLEYQKKLETTISTTEKLLQARKATDALRLLDSHASLFTRSSAFQKLLETARAQSERLRKIDEVISRAAQALEKEDYGAARTLLQEGCQVHGSTPELERQLEEVAARQSLAAGKAVKKVLGDAQILAMATQYQAALDKLAYASDLLSVISPTVKSEYEALQTQAAHGLARQRIARIEHHIAAGEFPQAAELLRQSLLQFAGNRDLLDLEKVLREETNRVSEAQQIVAEAQMLSGKREWKAAGELLKKAFSIGQRSPAVREQVIAGLIGAAESALEADWRVSEALLKQLAELQPDYTQPPSLHSKISRRKREESVNHCLEQAKRFQAAGDLQAALREVARGMAEHREESRLLTLRKEIQEQIYQEEEKARAERARQEKEAFVQATTQRAQREPALEKRIRILEEALTKYLQEPQLQQQLTEAQELADRVTAIVNQARSLEGAKQYPDAIRQWNALRSIHAEYPGLDSIVARVTALNEQARAAAQAAWIQRVENALASADYNGVTDLLTQAKQEFPQSHELTELDKKLQDVLKLRAKAQTIIAEGHAAASSRQWGKAADCLSRACNVAARDPVVREQVLSELLEACGAAVEADWQAAEMLLAQATEVESTSPLLSPLRSRIENQKREQNIERFLTAAVRTQSGGDLQGAVRELERGLSEYPGESRLTQIKHDVETRLRQLEEERQRQREAEKERARQLELERQRQAELKRQQELEREKARAAEQEQKRARARELEQKREQDRARQEEERKRQAERKRLEEERKLEEEAEKKRRAEAEKQAEEARRQHIEAEKLRAAEAARRRAEDLKRTSFQGTKGPEQRPPSDADAAVTASPMRTSAPVGVETDPTLTQAQISATLSNASLDSATVITPPPEKITLPLQPVQKPPLSRNIRMLVIGAGLLAMILLAVWLLIPRTVPVQITTIPLGATVRIKDTNQECVTPRCNLKLRPGTYEIETRLKGYETKTQTISVETKGQNSTSVALVPPPPPTAPPVPAKPARILIRGWNRGSEVFLDGKSLGTVGRQGTFSTAMAAGEHEIKVVDKDGKSGTMRGYFASGESAALAKKDFAVGTPPLPPPPPPSPEEKDWLQVKDSGSLEDLAKFRARYPNGAHHGEVEAKLDDLHWNRAKQANSGEEYTRYLNEHPDGMHRDEAKAGIDDLAWNTAGHSNTVQAVQDYLAQHSQGRHAGEARKMIETLKFQTASSSEDEALLESFLRDYPSGDRHAQIYRHLDDVVWQKTNKNDVAGLQAYSARFPDGRHMNEASSDLDKLTAPKPSKPPTPVINDRAAILDVIAQYNRAYNDRNIDELRRIWPRMDKKQVAAQRDFFKTVSSVTSTYSIDQEPQITGEEATVVFTQVLDYVVQGRREKPLSGTRTVRLRRIPGAPGVWKIDSMSGN
jgi:serine/threonine protein kinase